MEAKELPGVARDRLEQVQDKRSQVPGADRNTAHPILPYCRNCGSCVFGNCIAICSDWKVLDKVVFKQHVCSLDCNISYNLLLCLMNICPWCCVAAPLLYKSDIYIFNELVFTKQSCKHSSFCAFWGITLRREHHCDCF